MPTMAPSCFSMKAAGASVTCHGASGKGDGVAAAALNPKPADWTSAKVKGDPDGVLFCKIANGKGPMPPWKHLPEKERWDLIAHIRSLQGGAKK